MPDFTAVFYLADPTTNEPRFILAAVGDVLSERDRLVGEAHDGGREPVHKWIRSLITTPLLLTLPRVDASTDEQLALWHTIYAPLGPLSSPPEDVTASADLVAKYAEWVNLKHRQIAPRKPVGERRERRKPRPSPSPTPSPEPPKPKPKPKPKPPRQRTGIQGSDIRRCAECEAVGKMIGMRTHQRETGHSGEVAVQQDDPDVLAAYEAQQAARRKGGHGGSATRYRCDECGMVTVSGALAQHQKRTGHAGRTKVPKKKEAILGCGGCEFLGNAASLRAHQDESGHRGESRIARDEADAATLAEFERQKRERVSDGVANRVMPEYRCADCGLESTGAGIGNHHKTTGHTGRTKLGG